MIRHTLLAAAAVLCLSAPALAQNVVSANNTAAGIGNVAVQQAMTKQFGGGGLFGGSNTASINNTAAGIGNVA
ncbi:MAG TPA: hypothetical protein VED21_24765, partial [Azospirillum sp.]|nr:hypothetical protein [Azospirillum sp.]